MCGIVGAVSKRDVVPVLLEGLNRLEYRGYDSAGLAVLNGDASRTELKRLRTIGRVAELVKLATDRRFAGEVGIAHTRWATHGVPSERNAHPHQSGDVAVVHNGIIENHEAKRAELKTLGYAFDSDTDTEVIAHLVREKLKHAPDLVSATRAAVAELEGAYAIAVVASDKASRIAVARKGAPLLLGLGDVAEVALEGCRVFDAGGREVDRPVHVSELASSAVELGPYRHFMQKEIFEQPGAVAATLEMVLNATSISPQLFGVVAEPILRETDSVLVIACGTSYHAGVVARYWIESVAGLPCTVEIASEYRYRDSVPNPRQLVVTISQSGETADTLAALQHAKGLGHWHSLTICNVPESALVRQSELRFLTRAGPEIGVASTKAFTTQLAVLVLLAMVLAKLRGRLSADRERELIASLRHLPAALQQVLGVEPAIQAWAGEFASKQHALFLGRGIHFPIAMEGALKLKEMSYIHAEAYPAGELKHGPLALLDRQMPVVAIAPNDALLEKLKSNLQEVRARGGELYVVADQGSHVTEGDGMHVLRLTGHAGLLSPILHTVPLQLLAYHTALLRGTDVDKPRNLAKSVTVE